LDSFDNPHISYNDGTNNDLKYAFWNGTEWNIQTVDSTGQLGMYTSIALDSFDNPHISYMSKTIDFELKYAFWNGTEWNIITVDSTDDVGLFNSIVLDSFDNPHISYNDRTNDDLKYAFWNGTEWNIQTVDSTDKVGTHTSIALDSSDNPHISYRDNTNKDLKYAFWNGNDWNIQTITGTAYYSEPHISIALDQFDSPHISYYGGNLGGLMYCYWTGFYWVIQSVDSYVDCGFASSLTLDSNNFPHISYFYSWEDSDLKYAHQIAENQPPNIPDINGPNNGNPEIEYTFCITPIDPDGDNLYLKWDWDDGENSGWGGPFESGEEICDSHIWNDRGEYTITVSLKDDNGATIRATKEISIPRTRTSSHWMRLLDMFPLFQRILDLMG
jgi:hypothetical protein